MLVESTALTTIGALSGFLLLQGVLLLAVPFLEAHYGLHISVGAPNTIEFAILVAAVFSGSLIGVIPAWRAYRNSLVDGLTIRI